MQLPAFYRGIILVKPFGTYIKNNIKVTIIKSINLHNISGKPLLLIEDKKALGIIYLSDPIEINIEQFKQKYNEHRITNSERIKWWGKRKILYEYKIIKKDMYDIPLNINYYNGPQILVKPENIWQKIDKSIYIGTSGYENNKEEYYKNLNSVEINYTYYHKPLEKTWKKWENETNKTFGFSIKLNQNLLYYQNSKAYNLLFEEFMQGIDILGKKCKVLLIQFSKRYANNNNNINQLIKLINKIKIRNKKIDVAIEFRDNSWFCAEIYDIMKRKKCGIVITNINNKNDWTNLIDGFNPPLINDEYVKTTNFIYIRMHGSEGKYVGSYDNKILKNIMNFIEPIKIKRVYIYFNNTNTGNAYDDALRLTKKIVLSMHNNE